MMKFLLPLALVAFSLNAVVPCCFPDQYKADIYLKMNGTMEIQPDVNMPVMVNGTFTLAIDFPNSAVAVTIWAVTMKFGGIVMPLFTGGLFVLKDELLNTKLQSPLLPGDEQCTETEVNGTVTEEGYQCITEDETLMLEEKDDYETVYRIEADDTFARVILDSVQCTPISFKQSVNLDDAEMDIELEFKNSQESVTDSDFIRPTCNNVPTTEEPMAIPSSKNAVEYIKAGKVAEAVKERRRRR